MKFNFLIILCCTVTGIFINAQTVKEPLYFNEYLAYVKDKNLGLAAQKYNVSMAEASILTAGIFPDPQIEMETSNNGVSKDLSLIHI